MKLIWIVALVTLVGCAGTKDPKCVDFYKKNEDASKDLGITVEDLNAEFELSKLPEKQICTEEIVCGKKTYCVSWENKVQ
jgi:hypothetical protein